MTKSDIKNILETGETEQIEFKLNFGNSAIVSINAFANTKGGKILIGVDDNKAILGVDTNVETVQNWVHPVR